MSEESTMIEMQTASNFQFSAASFEELEEMGASEYTLGSIVCDESGSVAPFAQALQDALKTVLGSCKRNPLAENMMLRTVAFNYDVREIHGFRPVTEINNDEYDNAINPGGGTALFDAVLSAIEATNQYAEMLNDQDYMAAGVLYIITDGDNNIGSRDASAVARALQNAIQAEHLQSIAVILIEVGDQDQHVQRCLQRFKNDAGLHQFIDLTDLFQKNNPEKALAKLAGFIEESMSTTSQALQNGSSTASSSLLAF